ncbi:MAG TPA: hypothetical protein O0X27_04640, partial [Methanocorpusculum sp.]|nr:hypothetical protein [Methanocorpusculum sp.]
MIATAVLLMAMVFAGAASATGNITISNATGSTELSGAPVGTVVYGDYGQATNGTLKLVQIGSETQPWILELNNFTVRNTGTSIINVTDICDVKIVLKGTSDLMGNFSSFRREGLINSFGNLTITTEGSDGTLIVNNTAPGQYSFVRTVRSTKNITIASDAEVTAIADNYGDRGRADAILAEQGVTIAGENTVVKATATSKSSSAYSIYAYTTIDICLTKNVMATAESRGDQMMAYGLCAETGNITISDHANVTATATATNTNGCAYALSSYNGGVTVSDHAKVTATATATNAEGFAYVLYSSGIDGDILIESDAKVTAIATVTGVSSSAHAIHTSYFGGDVTIASGANVAVTATATNASSYSCAITTSYGAVTIDSGANVTATATATDTDSKAYVISIAYSDEPLTISNQAKVTATAIASNTDSAAKTINTNSGDLRILSGAAVTAVAAGNQSASSLVSDSANIIIENASTVET